MSFVKKRLIAVIIIFNVLAIDFYLFAAEQFTPLDKSDKENKNYLTGFKYDGKDRRDPFIPLVTQQGKVTTGLTTIGSLKDIVLEGIVWDPKGGSIVIINQNILKEKDYVGDYQISKIEPNRVILTKGDKEYIVILTKEGE